MLTSSTSENHEDLATSCVKHHRSGGGITSIWPQQNITEITYFVSKSESIREREIWKSPSQTIPTTSPNVGWGWSLCSKLLSLKSSNDLWLVMTCNQPNWLHITNSFQLRADIVQCPQEPSLISCTPLVQKYIPLCTTTCIWYLVQHIMLPSHAYTVLSCFYHMSKLAQYFVIIIFLQLLQKSNVTKNNLYTLQSAA